MNIFFTSTCPILAAKDLDNVRLNKMILETAQILSTNNHLLGRGYSPYKTTHANHPSTVWARTSLANMIWLVDHFQAMCSEYTHRSKGKIHKTSLHLDGFRDSILAHNATEFASVGITAFANCTLDSIRDLGLDTIISYRVYMCFKWHFDSTHAWIKLSWANNSNASIPEYYTLSTIHQYQDLYAAYESKRLNDKALENAKKTKALAKKTQHSKKEGSQYVNL